MTQSKYPAGWDEERVRRVLEHYEAQSDEEAVAEDEAACEGTTHRGGHPTAPRAPQRRRRRRSR